MTPGLILLGPRGSGKTTVGRIVADRLAVPFADLDADIVNQAGRSIAELFAAEGEAGFRPRETAALRAALARPGVLATGGGVVVTPENRDLLRATGCRRVLLIADASTLFARITADAATATNRPALTSHEGIAEVEHLLATRSPLYAAVATETISVDHLDAACVAARLIAPSPTADDPGG